MPLDYYFLETGNIYPNSCTGTAIYADTQIDWKGLCPTISNVPYQREVEIKPTPKEGVEMKGLYDVYLIYGEDRADILLKRKEGIIASDDEDAKIKSGLMKDVQDSWDADYLTFIVRRIGDVKVKERPKEVKQVI